MITRLVTFLTDLKIRRMFLFRLIFLCILVNRNLTGCTTLDYFFLSDFVGSHVTLYTSEDKDQMSTFLVISIRIYIVF